MTGFLKSVGAFLSVILFSFGVVAAPVSVPLSSFPGNSDVYHFGTSGAPSNTSEVSFVGGIGQVPATSGSWGAGSSPSYNSWILGSGTINFATPVNYVGFYFGGNTANEVELNMGLGGSTTGTFDLITTGANFGTPADGVRNWIFYGFYDAAGISFLNFGREQSNGWVYGLGELTFGVQAAVQVPEPGSLALLGLGLAGLAAIRKRKQV